MIFFYFNRSICNAVGELYEALELSPHRFEARYGVSKPEDDDPIVFSCAVGIRSHAAIQIAESLGFTR